MKTAAMDSQGNPRLLIVDDDRKLAGLIRDYLTPLGYDVELRHNGPDGLAEALAIPYQAVILDVMMPGMDGFAVLRELRKKSDVPVLMLTARGDEADRERQREEVSDRRFDVFDRSIDVHGSSLRNKLGDDAKSPRFIRTIRGIGYSLLEPDHPDLTTR